MFLNILCYIFMNYKNYQLGDYVLARGKVHKITKVEKGNIYNDKEEIIPDYLILLSRNVLLSCGFHEQEDFFLVKFSNNNMAKVIPVGSRWVLSIFIYPHFGAIAEYKIDSLVQLQHKLRESLGEELSINDKMITAAVQL